MSNLRGFLWSMGRCGTRALIQTINECTEADATSWVDGPRIMEMPNYFIRAYPSPFVLTLLHPHYAKPYASLLKSLRQTPVVLTVRDPIANLKSYAKVFLSSFVARRIDATLAHVASGKTVVASINPGIIDDWVMPMIDYWQHWSAIKDSPHRIIDISDLGEARFTDTLTSVASFLGLKQTKPIVWSGIANIEADNFFISYVRGFTLFDRKIELRFSRWADYWSEPGLVTLGQLRSSLLDELLGPCAALHVHVKADQLLTHGSLEREREAFAVLMAGEDTVGNIAAQIVKDHQAVSMLVQKELEALQAILFGKYEARYRDGVKRFLRAHPHLAQSWPNVPPVKAA